MPAKLRGGKESRRPSKKTGPPKHGIPELFSGRRQEGVFFGQESDALDLDSEAEADLPAGAPPKPTHKAMSPQALFISDTRVGRKASTGVRALTEVDTALKK